MYQIEALKLVYIRVQVFALNRVQKYLQEPIRCHVQEQFEVNLKINKKLYKTILLHLTRVLKRSQGVVQKSRTGWDEKFFKNFKFKIFYIILMFFILILSTEIICV